MNQIEVKSVDNIDDIWQIEHLQKMTWDMSDLEVLPGRFMHAMQDNGAALIGAYNGDQVIGFVFGILGTVPDLQDRVAAARLQMYSAIMGVLPEYQGRGIGYRLKLAQREFALRNGVRLITWTYDPLESRNAYLNIAKLGVVCNRYFRNYHGDMTGINVGLPSDRFYVEWWVTSNRVKSRVAARRGALTLDSYLGGGAAIINPALFQENDFPVPADEFFPSEAAMLLVEVPSDIRSIKEASIEMALRWRSQTRDLFETYFERRYLVTDFLRHRDSAGRWRGYYVLTRTDS